MSREYDAVALVRRCLSTNAMRCVSLAPDTLRVTLADGLRFEVLIAHVEEGPRIQDRRERERRREERAP